MKEFMVFFFLSVTASLVADFILIAFLGWWQDELETLERNLNDCNQ